jgi:hypothetical protein
MLPTAKGLKRAHLRRMSNLYTKMLTAQQAGDLGRPEATVDVERLQTREEAETALRTILSHRTRQDRLTFWRATFNKDILTSQLEASRHVIDIRKMATSVTYSTIKSNHWAASCDLLSRHIVGQREADQSLRLSAQTLGCVDRQS